ncbi:MAG: hypothetical protein AAF481_01265 [Acidobacteriota bacterium]
MCELRDPEIRYPKIEVSSRSAHPLALIGATRQALRRAGIGRPEIEQFSGQAFGSGDPATICGRWVRLTVEADD